MEITAIVFCRIVPPNLKHLSEHLPEHLSETLTHPLFLDKERWLTCQSGEPSFFLSPYFLFDLSRSSDLLAEIRQDSWEHMNLPRALWDTP